MSWGRWPEEIEEEELGEWVSEWVSHHVHGCGSECAVLSQKTQLYPIGWCRMCCTVSKTKNPMFTHIWTPASCGGGYLKTLGFLGLLGQYSTFCTTTLGTIGFFGTVQHSLHHRRERVVLSPHNPLLCTIWRCAFHEGAESSSNRIEDRVSVQSAVYQIPMGALTIQHPKKYYEVSCPLMRRPLLRIEGLKGNLTNRN